MLIGYGDFHASEVQGTVLILLLFSFSLALTQSRGAWFRGLMIGIGVPGAHLVGLFLGSPAPYPVQPNVVATFLALIPAMIGTCTGILLGNAWFADSV